MKTFIASLSLALLPLVSSAATVQLRQVAIEINGTKFWLPSQITVEKGDDVKIELVSRVPGKNNAHGYQIAAFGIEEVITSKPKTIQFKADKEGIFPINCHMHPAHIGGQLIVLD